MIGYFICLWKMGDLVFFKAVNTGDVFCPVVCLLFTLMLNSQFRFFEFIFNTAYFLICLLSLVTLINTRAMQGGFQKIYSVSKWLYTLVCIHYLVYYLVALWNQLAGLHTVLLLLAILLLAILLAPFPIFHSHQIFMLAFISSKQ